MNCPFFNFCLNECHWDLAADEDTANEWKLVARYSANIPLSLLERGLEEPSLSDGYNPPLGEGLGRTFSIA